MHGQRTFLRVLATLTTLLFVVSVLPAGTPDLKTYFASDFTDMAYQQAAHTKVGKSWKIPAETPEPGSKAVVIVTILRDGSLLEARLHHRSGSDAWDKAALQAVDRASPLGPLPKEYPRTSVEVHFHFELNP